MTQKIDFPTNIPNNLIDTFYNIHAHLPLGDTTECVLLENALDRIVSDDVLAVENFPSENLSKYTGWGISSHIVNMLDTDKELNFEKLYFWEYEWLCCTKI